MPTPIPYTYGTWRSLNGANNGMCWRTIQPTQGAYTGNGSDQNAMVFNWATFDARLDEAAAANVSMMYVLFRVPQWAVSAGDQAFIDSYGGAGASGVPLNMQYVRDFVTALLQRAISRGRRLKYLELWNEPEMDGVGGTYKAFSGTAAQMVQMCWNAFSAAKAVDPKIIVLCPSQYNSARLNLFLSTRDGVSGKFGYECCDALNIHPYRQGPNKATQSGNDALYWTAGGGIGIREANRILSSLGQPPKPVYVTEWGLSTQVGDPEVIAFNALPGPERKKYVARMLAMAMLGGAAGFTIFSNGTLAGNFDSDPWVIAAVNEVAAIGPGKTLVYPSGWLPDGSVTLVNSLGQRGTW